MSRDTTSSYKFGPFHLDVGERLLLRQGKVVPLTQKAFETLLALVRQSGHLLEKDELMKTVWADTFVEESNLSQTIFLLRKALGQNGGNQKYIETVPRRGYRFVAAVTESHAPRAERADKKPARKSRPSKKTVARVRDKVVNSLAVLPLVNESSDENAEYLSDGITESIINSLSQLPQLHVMAHSTVLRYKGREVDPQEVGRELSVRAVLTGRVIQLGGRLIIRTELVDVANGWQLWGAQYDRPPSDILEVQEEIAQNISDKLKLKLTRDEKKRLARRYTENTEAYHLYLRGRYFLNKYYEESVLKGIECFNAAIAVDEDYALAYAGLSDSYYRLGNMSLPPREAMPKAKVAALKAIELDDNLAEAHSSLGLVKVYYDYDLAGAEREYKRALELNPFFSLTHLRYGSLLMYANKHFDKAMAELKLALELDPLSLRIIVTIGTCLFLMGRNEEALAQYQKALDLEQTHYPADFCMGVVYARLGRYEEALAKFSKVRHMVKEAYLPLAFEGYVFAVSGRRREAIKIVKQLEEVAKHAYVTSYGIAIIYAGLGEKELALEWLEKTYEEHGDWMIWLNVAPEFDDLRTEPGFIDLIKRIGFAK
jgi:TolB-like protein/Tfp pilus assembly protein PilF